jgi:pyruvate kinase
VESCHFTSQVGFKCHIPNFTFFALTFSFFNSIESRVPDWLKDVDARVQYGINFGKSRGFIRAGDPIIVITGWKQGSGFTNTFRLLYVDTD